MAELLLELFSEEIPARMQARAVEDLQRLLTERLEAEGLAASSAKSFAGPRRLTLVLDGLPTQQADRTEERKGPKVGAPEAAVQGFLRAAGLTSLDQCSVQDDKKGAFYVAARSVKGRPTAELLATILPSVLREIPWPKSMRWGAGWLKWVRPLHGLLCIFDGKLVPVELRQTFDDIPNFDEVESLDDVGSKPMLTATAQTFGHRFHSSGAIAVKNFADYEAKLLGAHVVLDPGARAKIIHDRAKEIANEIGGELLEDSGLLAEVTGLVEWPVVLRGRIEDRLTQPIEEGGLPHEVLTTAMRAHQKYFSIRDPRTGRLAPHFIVVANLNAKDGGAAIVAGNERVLRARLSDAKFFWDQDRKKTLESRIDALANIVFHAKLGTVREKVERVAALAKALAPLLGADAEEAERAARLAKADLTTLMVGEFPELQGLMGRYYAQADGEPAAVALAIEEHYKPLGPSDECPSSPVSVAVALADKIDTLVGFFAIDEKPTGSKDPFALRRAALGVIRLILENKVRIPLQPLIVTLALLSGAERARKHSGKRQENVRDADTSISEMLKETIEQVTSDHVARYLKGADSAAVELGKEILRFLADRLKVALREKGVRHDLIDSVFALGGEDDLARLVLRVEALQSFLSTDDGTNLLAGYRRALNILKIEEKKDKRSYDAEPDPRLLEQAEEQALFKVISEANDLVAAEVQRERFEDAMIVMARLRGPVDAFFDKVTVNAQDGRLRENRLLLLSQIRKTLHAVADFSKIEG